MADRIATRDRFVLYAQDWLQSLRSMSYEELTTFEQNLIRDLESLLDLDPGQDLP
jgi:hypothetical protein